MTATTTDRPVDVVVTDQALAAAEAAHLAAVRALPPATADDREYLAAVRALVRAVVEAAVPAVLADTLAAVPEPPPAPPTAAEQLTAYLHARGLVLTFASPAASVRKVTEEARELADAWDAADDAALTADGAREADAAVRRELADVALACAVLARELGTTVEECVREKTEHDRDRDRVPARG